LSGKFSEICTGKRAGRCHSEFAPEQIASKCLMESRQNSREKGGDMISVAFDKKRKLLVIKMPVEKPRPSASGKTLLIATTRGLHMGGATYSGRPIAVVANAFIYPELHRHSETDRPSKEDEDQE
jgi:hypothetical protein